jgi:hypothetical protein
MKFFLKLGAFLAVGLATILYGASTSIIGVPDAFWFAGGVALFLLVELLDEPRPAA